MKTCKKGLHTYDDKLTQCWECKKIGHRAWSKRVYDKDPSKERERKLIFKYGITLVQYNEMLKSQDSRCRGCERSQHEIKAPLHVDHCHTTNEIRGLLCYDCNRALGLLKDNVTTLNNLIQYIKKDKL